MCVCLSVGATNDLQIPWSCCGPGSVSALLIGKHESGLYRAAAEISASVCDCTHTHAHGLVSIITVSGIPLSRRGIPALQVAAQYITLAKYSLGEIFNLTSVS